MMNQNQPRDIDTETVKLPELPDGVDAAMVQGVTPPPDPSHALTQAEPATEVKEGEDPRFTVGVFKGMPNYLCRYCSYARVVEADAIDHYNKTHAPRPKAPTVVRSAYLVDTRGNPLKVTTEDSSNADDTSTTDSGTRNRSSGGRSADNDSRRRS